MEGRTSLKRGAPFYPVLKNKKEAVLVEKRKKKVILGGGRT